MNAFYDKRQDFYQSFHIELPARLFEFWTFYNELEQSNLSLTRPPVNLRLCPLWNLFLDTEPEGWDINYFDDSPEWIPLLDTVDLDGLHWGYFVESYPATCLEIVSYYRGGYITVAGNDLFEALHHHLTTLDRSLRIDRKYDEENSTYYDEALRFIGTLERAVRPMLGATPPWNRDPKIETRDGYGIALNPSLYRPISPLDPLIDPECQPTAEEVEGWVEVARTALAEGFPVTALKLGRDLWRFPEHMLTSHQLLVAAYRTLNQPVLLERLEGKHTFREAALSVG